MYFLCISALGEMSSGSAETFTHNHTNGAESGDRAAPPDDSFERDFKAMLREDGASSEFKSSLQFEQQDQSPFAAPTFTTPATQSSTVNSGLRVDNAIC